MSGHSFFSPSSAHRWMNCPGSMAWPENQAEGGSSVFADDGTASHHWAALCLKNSLDPKMLGEDCDAECFLGETIEINGVTFTMDEERAGFVQAYLDDVRRRAMGGILWVEHKVTLARYLGEGQGGTADAVIILPEQKTLIVGDLKYGMGERVDASYLDAAGVAQPNHQLGLYALGVLEDVRLLDYEIEKVLLVIYQPRLAHMPEFETTPERLDMLGMEAKEAAHQAGMAMILAPGDEALTAFLEPGDKTCRWCRAKAVCPKLAAYVADQVRSDFETIVVNEPTAPPATDTKALSRAMIAVPLVRQWCTAVEVAVHEAVNNNKLEVIGSDGKPYKFVEGDMGDRKWSDPEAAEQLLLTTPQIGPEKAYNRKLLTAPQAAKILDKKATKATWTDVFLPLVTRAPGKAMLALGSDPRPPYTGHATAEEFSDES